MTSRLFSSNQMHRIRGKTTICHMQLKKVNYARRDLTMHIVQESQKGPHNFLAIRMQQEEIRNEYFSSKEEWQL